MFSNFIRNLEFLRTVKDRRVRFFFGSNSSLYFSFLVWLFLANWDKLLTNPGVGLQLLTAFTAGMGSAYLVFVWLFYVYARKTDSLGDIFVSFGKLLLHLAIILAIIFAIGDMRGERINLQLEQKILEQQKKGRS